MSRQHPAPARTAYRPPLHSHSLVVTAAFALVPPVVVFALSYPLTAVTAALGLVAVVALARRVAPRVVALVEGRRTSVPVPGLGLRLRVELGLAEE